MAKLTTRLQSLLRHVLQDLDSYVVIATAISLAVISAAGVKLSDYLPGVTIALLALISLSLVRTRYRLQASKLPSITPTDVLTWRDSAAEIQDLIDSSKEIWIWGAALAEYMPMLSPTLRRGIGRGLRAKIMLIQPNSASLKMLAFRAVSPPANSHDASAVAIYHKKLDETARRLNRKLSLNIEDLEDIKLSGPVELLQYRTIDYLPPYAIFAFDPRSPKGRLLVRLGFHDGNNNERPTLWFSRQTDLAWFEHFLHQMETAWSAASALSEAGGWSASITPGSTSATS